MSKHVYDLAEGSGDMVDLMGGKGANLAEMARLGLPVPPGFTITTEACRQFLATGRMLPGLEREISVHLDRLERTAGKRFGDPDDPLLLSVRSGAKFSMPGMMDTILDIGLNDYSVEGLAKRSGDERFAWDSYRRLVQMFGNTVLGIDSQLFEKAMSELKTETSATSDLDLGTSDLKELVSVFRQIIKKHRGYDFPASPREQLMAAIIAVFNSWNSSRAKAYRRQERIPADLGTAVTVMAMVYGNLGLSSGTGVAFTRDPSSGAKGIYGDYLQDAQGEDVVAGARDPIPLQELEHLNEHAYRQLMDIMATLEHHYRDMCDIEFTIEEGKLWMLQTRIGKRSAAASFRIACQLVDEGLITLDEALGRVSGTGLAELMFPRFDDSAADKLLVTGVGASPGAAVGHVVFTSDDALARVAEWGDLILVRTETSPDDLPGMLAAKGVLTRRGGKTSHAAVVARGMGKPCVVAAQELVIDFDGKCFTAPDGTVVAEGDLVSIDGQSGLVYLGRVPVKASPVMKALEGSMAWTTEGPAVAELVKAVQRILDHADSRAHLKVRANADLPEDARRAREFGAQGIGLCRTEHMFLGERRQLVERVILADDAAERQEALDALLPLQRDDFISIFEQMEGHPVTIRLIDPPLHEFLPDFTALSVRAALAEATGKQDAEAQRLLPAVRRLHEANPMLGLRGVRLCLAVPGLVELQVRAIAEAVVECHKNNVRAQAQIMVPVVSTVQELEHVREIAEHVIRMVSVKSGYRADRVIGTMIELPRACLTADQLAPAASFFSFGTNDLTQTTWGFSRDDCEASFFPAYMEMGIFGRSPFETIDRDGVGKLMAMAVQLARAANPSIELGICGEHGGDPESIQFFHDIGLDYVSCSPFRVPVARLEAGRAALPSATASGVGASR